MRVVHVITRLIVGGAQENTIASVLGLRRKPGLEVTLISGPSHGPEGTLEREFAGQPGVLRVVPWLVRPIHPWQDVRAWAGLTSLFRRESPGLVHTHSGKAGVIGRLAARRAGVPLIVHTIHGPSFGPFQGALANAVFLAAERRAGRVTDHFVVVAEAMARQYLAAGIGAPRQYSRIFSGFEIEPYLQAKPDPALRSRLGLAEGDVVAGMIARLFALKGHDDLLDVAAELAARCPRLKFLWVGDGAWRPRLEARMAAMGLRDRFVLAGLVPPEAVPRYVALMDLLVHLSRREGLPRALPQALAAGRPVVAYDCDGAGEVCRDNETGFLVAPGDRVALADRVLRLAENPGLRQRLGECGRAFVRQRFPVERMVDELAVLYLQLAAGKAGRAGGGVPP